MVGFDNDLHPVYGKEEGGKVMYADALTLAETRRILRKLQGRAAKRIYQLVPVKEKAGEK